MRLTKYRGRWYVSFKQDGKYRRVSTGTSDREAAERIARDLYGAAVSVPNQTVAEIWKKAQADKGDRPAATNMRYHWKALEPVFGNLEPRQISVQDCRDYVRRRECEGKAPSTIATELKHLRSALRWAEKHQEIERAPFIEVCADSDARDRYLTKSEYSRVLDNASAPHIKLAIRLLLATAGRVTAVLELTWDRVDFDRQQVRLKLSERGKGRATVPVTDKTMAEILEAYRRRTSNYVVEYGGGPIKDIRTGLKAAAARAGVEDVTPHVFRHTAAVWMAEDGHSMEEISQFLGHRDVKTTRKHYAKFSPTHLRNLAKTLDV
jgi:integrase